MRLPHVGELVTVLVHRNEGILTIPPTNGDYQPIPAVVTFVQHSRFYFREQEPALYTSGEKDWQACSTHGVRWDFGHDAETCAALLAATAMDPV